MKINCLVQKVPPPPCTCILHVTIVRFCKLCLYILDVSYQDFYSMTSTLHSVLNFLSGVELGHFVADISKETSGEFPAVTAVTKPGILRSKHDLFHEPFPFYASHRQISYRATKNTSKASVHRKHATESDHKHHKHFDRAATF